MRLTVKKPPEMQYMPKRIEKEIRRFLSVRVAVALQEFQRSIMETPVYTGRTLVNYRWSVESPITGKRSPVKNPLLPGKTSEMSIGAEPRRAANQAIVEKEFQLIIRTLLQDFNPYQKFFLANNVENFTDIEYGSYSESSRTPAGGMTRRGEAKIKLIIRGIEKVG